MTGPRDLLGPLSAACATFPRCEIRCAPPCACARALASCEERGASFVLIAFSMPLADRRWGVMRCASRSEIAVTSRGKLAVIWRSASFEAGSRAHVGAHQAEGRLEPRARSNGEPEGRVSARTWRRGGASQGRRGGGSAQRGGSGGRAGPAGPELTPARRQPNLSPFLHRGRSLADH